MSRTMLGDHDAGAQGCEKGLALAPDPLNTALAVGWLGYAHLERGDPAAAIPHLEQAVQLVGQLGFVQPRAWFTAFLAEAHRLMRRLEPALELASQALDSARASDTPRESAGPSGRWPGSPRTAARWPTPRCT